MATRRQFPAPVKNANIIQPEEPALEDIVPLGVLSVNPPGEIEQELVENPFQEGYIARPSELPFDLKDLYGRPRMHRRVDITEVPFIGRKLAVPMDIPFPQQQG